MNMKTKLIYFVFFLLITSCGNNKCENLERDFTFDLSIRGVRDTMNLGDTIFYDLIIPHEATNTFDNSKVNIQSFNPPTYLANYYINGNEVSYNGYSFDYSPNFYLEEFDNSVTGLMLFDQLETKKEFNGYIICNTKGKYLFAITHIVTDMVMTDCPNRRVDIIYDVTNEDFNNNYYLIEDLSFQENLNLTEENFINQGGVVFVVK